MDLSGNKSSFLPKKSGNNVLEILKDTIKDIKNKKNLLKLSVQFTNSFFHSIYYGAIF